MILAKNEQMRAIDKSAIENIGIPGIVLMENAARGFVDVLCKQEGIETADIAVFCGLGNNGGDGFAIARMLVQKKIKVRVAIIGDMDRISGDAKINLEIMKKIRIPWINITDQEGMDKLKDLESATLLIDALLGTGCNKGVDGILAQTITWMNRSNRPVFAVDIPSGINGDNGRIMGHCVHAAKTVTFCLPKVGLFLNPGAFMTGEVIVIDIGIPEAVWVDVAFHYEIMDDGLSNVMPKRGETAHKGTFGKVLVIAGSKTMMGAAVLSSEAAIRSGCGMVKVMTEAGNESALFARNPEIMVETYSKDDSDEALLRRLVHNLNWADVVVMGPGMGNDSATFNIVRQVLQNSRIPIILDADALNVLASDLTLLESSHANVTITPHLGEMARLTGHSVEEIAGSTVEFATSFSQRYNVTVVLKSDRTLVADGEDVIINPFGNNGMATAGSGDVLAGMIGSMVAQTKQPLLGAVLGVYLHSKAGDAANERLGPYHMIASDIIDGLKGVLNPK